MELRELKVGDRYDYRDKGMAEPVRVVLERLGDDEVFTQQEKEKVGRRWQIDTFVQNATVVPQLNLLLGG